MRRFALLASVILASSSVALAGNQTGGGDDDMSAPPPAPTVVLPPAPAPPPPPAYAPYPPPQPYNPYNHYNNPYARYPVYAPPPPISTQPPRRVFGLGSSLSTGAMTISAGTDARATAGIIGDLWVEVPLSRKAHLELWVPILNMLASERGTLLLWGDVFYKRYIGGDGTGFFVAPGAGFIHVSTGGVPLATALQIPARIGYEFSTRNRSFGFTIAGRPWVDIWWTDDGRTATGWGGLLEIGFTGYWTRPQ